MINQVFSGAGSFPGYSLDPKKHFSHTNAPDINSIILDPCFLHSEQIICTITSLSNIAVYNDYANSKDYEYNDFCSVHVAP